MAQLFDGFFEKLFATKPDVPELKTIDYDEEQQKATKGNLAALPDLKTLASRVNDFTSSERLKALRNVMPGLDTTIADIMGGLGRGARGELPIEEQDQRWNSAVAKAVGSGAGGLDSGYGRGLVGRDLNIAKQEIFYKSVGAFGEWLQTGATYLTGPQMDFTSAFQTTKERAGFDVSERNTFWNYDWFKSQLDNAPEGWELALQGLGDNVLNLAAAYLTGGTSAMGGMGGGPQSSKGMPYGQEDAVGGSGEIASGFRLGTENWGIGKTTGGPWYLGAQPGKG